MNGTTVPSKYFTLTEIQNAHTTVSFGMKEEVCMPESTGGEGVAVITVSIT
jgi:hypothetical protein